MSSATQRGDADVAWRVTHEALETHARKRAGLDLEEGALLLAARRAEVHRHFGYGSFMEYVERLLGYSPRVTHDKLRVAQALEGLPKLARELQVGTLNYSHARELTRVATPKTEDIWLKSTRGRTVREVEKLVSGRRPGSLPDSPVEPAQQRHVLRFDVSGETLASFREAMAKLQRGAGEHLDDDALLLLLARHVLVGPNDDGRASYQVALDVCEDCQRARQLADGELIGVSTTVAAMAGCDAQRLPNAHVGAAPSPPSARATQDVPPAVRRAVLRRDRHRCSVPGCSHARFVDIHHIRAKSDGGDHHPRNLLTLCGAHHRAIHEGTLMVTENERGLVFSHADGTQYDSAPSAASSSLVQTRAYQALRALGFREVDARGVLARSVRALEPDISLDHLLRWCLVGLTERTCQKAS
ncbi:MAG: HNH endonuclease [Myxococcales bacterium]|nr:MAG: HNH endonuclease [Myxococcales bacterium]